MWLIPSRSINKIGSSRSALTLVNIGSPCGPGFWRSSVTPCVAARGAQLRFIASETPYASWLPPGLLFRKTGQVYMKTQGV